MAEEGLDLSDPDRSSTHGAVGLLLAGAMCLLPFLIPYHQPPLRSFYPEWVAAALGLIAFVAVLPSPRFQSVALPVPGRWMIGFAAFLVVCAIARDAVYPQMSLWAVVYVLYAVLMIWLGACVVAATGLEKTIGVLAACILAGALANAAAGVIQFYGRPVWLEDLIADLRGIRAYGNIAQPNLYANYLALGVAALLYLWVRRRVSGVATGCAAALLVWAIALSDSRVALLYSLWFAALGAFSARGGHGGDREGDMRGLCGAALALSVAMLAAYVAAPWFNGLFSLGPAGAGADGRLLNTLGDLRWPAWALALRIFAAAPIAGVGIGEFAGAAFQAGLPREMTDRFEVWTSPHNQVLQLLAETGAVGAVLALAGVGAWCLAVWRRHRFALQPATWWVIAAVGVELIHSLLEFPMWSAHFLGVTALLMGTLAYVPERTPGEGHAVLRRVLGAATCAGLAGTLVLGLRDYWRLDLTRATGAGSTLAGAAATQDAQTLRQLGHGLLAPMAEFWLCVGAPLNRDDLALKLRWSERVMHYFPANAIVGRRAIFLTLDGQIDEAGRLIDRLAHPSPEARQASVALLRRTQSADQAVIAPLIARIGFREPANQFDGPGGR